MAKVRTRIILTGITLAVLIDSTDIILVAAIPDLQDTF
jgi:hypothetical protein